MSKKQKLDDIRKLMLSLLLARKGATLLSVLERDYYEAESRRIPYHHFGFTDLVGFLQSMPEHFIVEQYNGIHYVRGIASEKSKHVGLLVARQKTQPKPKYIPPHLRQPFNRRVQHMKSQQVKIAPDKLFSLMHYVKNNPHGVSLQNAVAIIQQTVPFINITMQELRAQLYELSHQLYLDGNMIYPVWNNDARNVAHQQPLKGEPQLDELQSNSRSLPAAQTEYAAGQEDFVVQYFSDDDDDFVPAARIDNQRHAETSEQFATSHNMRIAQYANCERTEMFDKARDNGTEIDEDLATNSNMEMIAEIHDLSQIVNDRTKLRLEELMRKHPEGIWCADLPNAYFHEYKVRLNYTQLGFASVREFTSYLPKIFYMKQINKTDDFMLYSADKRPVVPKSDPIDITQTSHNRYGKHSTAQCSKDDDDDAPIPSDVSPTITKSFAPNDVMNYNDNVEKISVTELQKNNEYVAVYIVEVFHPNFFWIHLRENKRRFYKMMDELSDFYEYNKNTYTIAKIALKKDMNCACLYMGRWHRGIIKSVKPDFRVTVFFYDYGTLKTYAPEDIYYLHKKFSFLPAQAIPCGLYNVIPSVGDRWKKSVIDQFIDKIADTLLAATIISINPMYNSMMVILTDTSEEEDVVINKWLVNERLAQVGKTVRMFDIIHNLRFNTIESSTRIESSIKTFHAESAVNVNIPRYRNQSISHDEKMHRLSDVKSEDIENKTVKSLHNVPTSKKATIQMLRMLRSKSPDAKSSHFKSPSAKSLNTKCANAESVDTKTLDIKSQSRKYVRTRESKMSRKLVSLEKLKTLNQSDSNPSMFKANTDNEDNARPIDSNRNLQNNNDDYNCYGYMNFSLRNSDDENDTEDFGTFRSLYGGHGFMEPFDWSVIREENNRPHGTIATVSNNLDMSIGKHESDVEDKSGSYKKNEIPGKQYFLNMTRMETEKFLSKNNIDYDVENMSDFIETLRDKTTSHHIIKVMFAPNNKFKTLDNIQSEDTSNANIVNDIASSEEVDQEVDKNDKVCETRVDQKMENRDSNTVSESVFSNISNNKNNINKEISERKTNNFLKSNTNNKVYHPMYKTLLDKMKQMRLNLNSNFMNSSESSSSEQILSSSYSCNTSDDTITSSNDGQSNCMDTSNRIKIQGLDRKLRSMSVELSKNQTLNEPHSDSKETALSSTETDSIASSNVDDIKQHRLNQSLKIDSLMSSNVNDTKQHQLNQSFDSDSIISSYSDDSKCQLNGADQTALNIPKLMQQMLKMVRNIGRNTELDSDDLSSSQESIRDDESDGDNKSDCVSETFQSMSDAKVIEIASASPVYNDCDIESDESEWDAYAGSEDFPFYIAQPPK